MIDTSRADALDSLADTIFTLTHQDDATDSQLYNAIADVAQAVDGRIIATGFKYTLNVTNALQLRPKHWFMELEEYNIHNPGVSSTSPAFCGLQLVPDAPTGFAYSNQAYGNTIGLAACGVIAKTWAQIIRLWVNNNYPLAIAPYQGV